MVWFPTSLIQVFILIISLKQGLEQIKWEPRRGDQQIHRSRHYELDDKSLEHMGVCGISNNGIYLMALSYRFCQPLCHSVTWTCGLCIDGGGFPLNTSVMNCIGAN